MHLFFFDRFVADSVLEGDFALQGHVVEVALGVALEETRRVEEVFIIQVLEFQNLEKIVKFSFAFFFDQAARDVHLLKNLALQISRVKSPVHVSFFEETKISRQVFLDQKTKAVLFVVFPGNYKDLIFCTIRRCKSPGSCRGSGLFEVFRS